MKRSLSFSATSAAALVVFATTLAGSMSASAADRAIGVQQRPGNLKSFKVQDVATAPVIEVAETDAPKRPDRVKPKAFTVNDNQNDVEVAEPAPRPKKPKAFKVQDEAEVAEPAPRPKKPKAFRVEEDSEVAVAEPAPRPKKQPSAPKIQEFTVDEDTGEVADTPTPEVDDEVESAEVERTPPKKLKPQPSPEALDDQEEDSAEAPADTEEQAAAIAEDDDEPTILRKPGYQKRRKAHVVYAADDSYQSYDSYQPRVRYSHSYAGSSCNQNSYNGY